jgi:hypothetical protein
MATTEGRLRQLLAAGQLDLPLPAHGESVRRLLQLHDLCAGESVSVGRLLEAHCDATAILAEAGRALPSNASRHSGGAVRATPRGRGWRINGSLRFCSGAPIIDVALVDVAIDDHLQLMVVPLRDGGVDIDLDDWRTAALADTATATVEFELDVDSDALIAEPNFYLRRLGFWHGSVGVAACWAGCARGVFEATRQLISASAPHADAHMGRAAVACWSMVAALERAGRQIDERPGDVGFVEALTVRHLVAEECLMTLESCRRAAGAGPMVFDESYAKRHADLRLYLQQHHFEADLAYIGTAAVTDRQG